MNPGAPQLTQAQRCERSNARFNFILALPVALLMVVAAYLSWP